jgi:hypothetical protein
MERVLESPGQKAGGARSGLLTPTQHKAQFLLLLTPASSLARKDLFTELLEQEEQSLLQHEPGSGSYSGESESPSQPHWPGFTSARKRRRKNNRQIKLLRAEYGKNQHWDKFMIRKIARLTGLSESQVYKWCWDQKKKNKDEVLSEEDDIERTSRPRKRLFYG